MRGCHVRIVSAVLRRRSIDAPAIVVEIFDAMKKVVLLRFNRFGKSQAQAAAWYSTVVEILIMERRCLLCNAPAKCSFRSWSVEADFALRSMEENYLYCR